MAVSHSGTYVQLPKCGLAQILNADALSRKTLITAGADGNKVTAISMSNNDTFDRLIQIWLARSGVFYLLNTVNVATNSGGVATVAPVNALNNWTALPIDNDGQKYFYLESGDVLSVASTTSVSVGAFAVSAVVVHGTF